MITILYSEQKSAEVDSHGEPGQLVRVCVRLWEEEDTPHGHRDCIMECLAIVDGDEMMHSTEVLQPRLSKAEMIRAGIREFDQLLAGHPTLRPSPEKIETPF
jgi:hypothetical protein